MVSELAGLLTDSRPDAFPTYVWVSGHADGFRTLIGASQQRDCPGFAPDSLLLSFRECEKTNQFCDKDRKLLNFFTNFFVAFCVVCFAMFCFLGRCLEYGLHDGHKNVVCDNYLILSGLSMDRIGRLQLDKRIRKRERTYTGGSKRA